MSSRVEKETYSERAESCYHAETAGRVKPNPIPNRVLIETVANNERLHIQRERCRRHRE
jgi:hypothetical protein